MSDLGNLNAEAIRFLEGKLFEGTLDTAEVARRTNLLLAALTTVLVDKAISGDDFTVSAASNSVSVFAGNAVDGELSTAASGVHINGGGPHYDLRLRIVLSKGNTFAWTSNQVDPTA